jgi:hypothetical protein
LLGLVFFGALLSTAGTDEVHACVSSGFPTVEWQVRSVQVLDWIPLVHVLQSVQLQLEEQPPTLEAGLALATEPIMPEYLRFETLIMPSTKLQSIPLAE